MSKDSLEHISSLMDGELSHETSLFVAKRMGSDEGLGKAWSRYHLVRECLRRPGGKWALTSMSLDLEGIEPSAGHTGGAAKSRWLRPVSGLAIAASVAMVAVLLALPTPRPTESDATVATTPFTSPNPLPVVPVAQPASFNGSSQAGNRRLNTYLLRHNQVAGAAGRQGFVSFMPIVTAAPVQVMDPAEQKEDSAAEAAGNDQTPQP